MNTPRELGYRWPAEWEPQQSVWLAWPHDSSLWPIELEPIWRTFGLLIAELASVQRVDLIVPDRTVQESAKRWIADGAKARGVVPVEVRFHELPTDDCWVRDSGPIFVTRAKALGSELAGVDFGFNGWGKFEPFAADNDLPRQVTQTLGISRFETGIILEGGSIDGNGAGLILTTEECLLNPNRNPHLKPADYERILRDFLGAEQVIWLGQGLYNDHTDGHVDVVTRFVSRRRVVTLMTAAKDHPSYPALAENLRRLRDVRWQGQPIEITELPLPEPVMFDDEPLAAGYANFVMANGLVIVPTYGCPADDLALGILREVFPDRRVTGLRANDLLKGGGAFHCVTQQMPSIHSLVSKP